MNRVVIRVMKHNALDQFKAPMPISEGVLKRGLWMMECDQVNVEDVGDNLFVKLPSLGIFDNCTLWVLDDHIC